MSDETSSTSAIASSSNHPTFSYEDEYTPPPPTAAQLAERRKENRRMFNKKRGELLDDLLRSLDILVFAELSAIYYMDCSFFRFLIRGIVQFILLSPKPSIFPPSPPHRPYIGAIIGSNILCILLHLFTSAPSASEATRGYLHGGVAMDFIGQKGPTSKIHLLILDVLVVVFQLAHLSAHVTRLRLKDTSVRVTTSRGREYTAQTVEAEERGVRRSDEQQDIEMQTLNPATGAAATAAVSTSDDEEGEADSSESSTLLSATAAPRTDAHIFDAFNSGQIVLTDIDIFATVRDQLVEWRDAPPDEALQTSADLRANLFGQLRRLRSIAGG